MKRANETRASVYGITEHKENRPDCTPLQSGRFCLGSLTGNVTSAVLERANPITPARAAVR